MEAQNDDQIDSLHSKLQELKAVSIEIGNEAKSSTAMTSEMEDAMRGTQSAMKATVKRLTSLLERGDGQPMWYLVTFIVVLFLALYWLIKA